MPDTSTAESIPPALMPPLACDAHFHVFGPDDRYPPAHHALYPTPVASLEDYLRLARRMSVQRYVLVQPSMYGIDNRCMLDALRTLGPERARAVIDIDEAATNDHELAQLHDLGVRAVRMHSHASSDAAVIRKWQARLRDLAALTGELGWSIDFLMPGWLTREFLPQLRDLDVDFTIAHLGYLPASLGVAQPAFQDLLTLLRQGRGRAWIKLSGFYRMCDQEDYRTVQPFVEALLQCAADRLIWGSDYPHVMMKRPIHTTQQLELLTTWVPGEAARRQVLVENPARLYGFT